MAKRYDRLKGQLVSVEQRRKGPVVVRFRLSNRQQKELLVRGQRLQIAIPVDYDRHPDPLEFARQSLPEHAQYIVAAEHEEILVGRTDVVSDGLTAMLGQIDVPEAFVCIRYWVSVVVAKLECGKVRGVVSMQWPGALLDER